MQEDEVRGDPAVYDHETEDPRGARRRRHVADWGVGEELFDRMPSPRRRFSAPEPPRRDSHPRDSHPRDRRFEPSHEAAPVAEVDDAPPVAASELDAPTRELVTAARAAAPARSDRGELVPRGGVEGRRTVVIGRQSGSLPARRERPSRSVGERIGHRPDRIAGYAVALGLLLIIIAFLSS